MRRRAIIFTGGRLGDWAVEQVQLDDILIGADSGALFLVKRGLRPQFSLGDFDSVTPDEQERIKAGSSEMLACDPVMKDWTDTEMAYHKAVEMGATELVIFGALGTRFDHSLANVHLLSAAADQGIYCRIEDEFNRVELAAKGTPVYVEANRFTFVSLLPLSPQVSGIHLTGFQYPLQDATLRIGESLGISNRLLGDEGTVQVREGRLLVISSRD